VYNDKRFITENTADAFQISQEKKGHYEAEYESYKLRIIGLPYEPKGLVVNGQDVDLSKLSIVDGVYELVVSEKFWEVKLLK